MTVNGRTVTWKWVAGAALTIAGIFIMGLVRDVNANSKDISGMKSDIKHMAKQVDEIHGMIFEK